VSQRWEFVPGFYGPPIFLKAIRDAREWSVALVSAAITMHFLVGALAVANLPRLYGGFGLAPVTIAGAVSLPVGVTGWACATAVAYWAGRYSFRGRVVDIGI
jgi:hypothetical protein